MRMAINNSNKCTRLCIIVPDEAVVIHRLALPQHFRRVTVWVPERLPFQVDNSKCEKAAHLSIKIDRAHTHRCALSKSHQLPRLRCTIMAAELLPFWTKT